MTDYGPLAFPPGSPGSLGNPGTPKVIPSYLYYWYRDDDDLQAFVKAYNDQSQGMIDWFNQVGLSYYLSPFVTGGLLDWVAQGFYGLTRPVLPSGRTQWVGGLDTWAFDTIPFNTMVRSGSLNYYAMDDDFFKRTLTWHLWKGDGKTFNVRWLKRRIMRFITGAGGGDGDTARTYQISVTLGISDQVNIRLLLGTRHIESGAVFNTFALNSQAFNALQTSIEHFPDLGPGAVIFADALAAGALELPFQYSYVVTISNPTIVT